MIQRVLHAVKRRLTSSDASARFTETFPTVDVFEWRPSGGAINFGDHLATVVVAKVLADGGHLLGEQVTTGRRMFSVGSVLHFAATGDVVWGSGINRKLPDDRHVFANLDVRAVRGPRTAAFLRDRGINVPSVYGDPALLIPHLFSGRFVRQVRHKAVFVPNLHELGHVKTDLPVISPLQGWNRVVEQILSAEFVVSSSLHGLVIAESFGIPARYVRLTENENLFKYEDYVFGTGRDKLVPATLIEAALDMGGMPPAVIDTQGLLDAFPWDLWKA